MLNRITFTASVYVFKQPTKMCLTFCIFIRNICTWQEQQMVFYQSSSNSIVIQVTFCFLMSGISHFKDENSRELWFMHAWSETKEREMMTFTGNIKGQCGNCASRANCLPVLAISPHKRAWNSYLFAICFLSFSRNVEMQQLLKKKKNRNKCSSNDGNVNSKVFLNLNQIQRNIQVAAPRILTLFLHTACESTSPPARLHFCIKG